MREHPACVNCCLVYSISQLTDRELARHQSARHRPVEEQVIGNYRLIKTIGRGNFAKVKLAKHIPTGQQVSKFCELCHCSHTTLYSYGLPSSIRLQISS